MLKVSILIALLAGLIAASPASAGENKNTITFTINCGEAGTFTGSLPGGNGSALVVKEDDVRVAVIHGLATLGGQIIFEPTPGLEKQGKLVQCRFTFPGAPERIAFDLLAPVKP